MEGKWRHFHAKYFHSFEIDEIGLLIETNVTTTLNKFNPAKVCVTSQKQIRCRIFSKHLFATQTTLFVLISSVFMGNENEIFITFGRLFVELAKRVLT